MWYSKACGKEWASKCSSQYPGRTCRARRQSAGGDEDAVDATTLNVAALRLENLIHDRRATLTEKRVVASAAWGTAAGPVLAGSVLDAASVYAPKTAFRFVKDGRASLLSIIVNR
jgi:hypothetical protein